MDAKERFKGASDWLSSQHICHADDLASSVGAMTAPIGIVFDSIPGHKYHNNIGVSRELGKSGFTEVNSLRWYASFQKYKLLPRILQVSRQGAMDTKILSTPTQDLVEKSNMSVLLLYDQIAEDVAILEEDRIQALELRL